MLLQPKLHLFICGEYDVIRQTLKTLVILLATMTALCTWAQDHHKVNCKGEFDYSKTKLSISGSYLKSVSGSLSIDPQTAPTDKWTVALLSQQRTLCESYKASTEQQFPTATYLQQLEALRQWELDFMKISLGAQQVQQAQTAVAKGGKGPTVPIHTMQQNLAAQIKSLLNSPPQIQLPATAIQPKSFPDEPLN
jgi:hypothetical protein